MMYQLDVHNQFNESLERFKSYDPHLKRLHNIPLVHHSPLLDEPSFTTPGVYVITGGRQIGKTTFLKQLILKLLKKKTNPKGILFITGEIIDTHHILRRIIDEFHDPAIPHQYLFIDEVNYVPDWDKSIKFLFDSGVLETMSVFLTGSDSQIIRTAMKRFAGRRGKSDQVDFEFFPLSFKEFLCLKNKELEPLCKEVAAAPLTAPLPGYTKNHDLLTSLFYEYLLHGGYLPAINDYNANGTISKAVMNTYIHWIIGDILKFKKSENYLFEIFKGIKATYNTQISWNNLGKHVSIEHHKTIADYCNLLESLHVLHIQEAIIEHKLTGAPKKNRKIYFRDPFIDHAVSCHLNPSLSITDIKNHLQENKMASSFVEAVAVDNCKRWLPTYYIKGSKGEVDVAVVLDNKMVPVEVKWATKFQAEDLKQIRHYNNGIILTPSAEIKTFDGCRFLPLVRFLLHTAAHRLEI